MATLAEICSGNAGCWLNIACAPFVLLWNAFYFYVLSCFAVLGRRANRFFCKPFYYIFSDCCAPWVYTDHAFEGDKAIGKAGDGASIDWVRAYEILESDGSAKGDKPRLYAGGIEAADLCQGSVGDCWLVAALACAAENPACIRNAFLTPEANSRGMYRVRLFNPNTESWEVVDIDDRIPCAKVTKQPKYMQCDGKELWAVLLEKAFAKFVGSYAALDGGWAVWGWAALTGDHCFRLKFEAGKQSWSKSRFKAKMANGETDGGFYPTSEEYTKEQVWNLILNYIEDRSLVAASGGKDMGKAIDAGGGVNNDGLNGEQLNDAAGLVGTHAYSILDARELGLMPGLSFGSGLLGQTRLIQLRNPWGRYEWKGAWSDGSKEWDENPLVKMRLRPEAKDDGTFWMPWDQFELAGFHNIDICDRTTKRDLRLVVAEDWGFCGVVLGCLGGLFKFFCLCQGLLTIYCGVNSSTKTKTTKRGCAKCVEQSGDILSPVPVQIDRA